MNQLCANVRREMRVIIEAYDDRHKDWEVSLRTLAQAVEVLAWNIEDIRSRR